MYWDIDVTDEDEDEMINKIAEKVHDYGLDTSAIILFESIKPLSFVGGQMGRFFISPVLPILGNNLGISGEKFFRTFEKRDNLEKLVKALEDLNLSEKNADPLLQENNEDSQKSKKKSWLSSLFNR